MSQFSAAFKWHLRRERARMLGLGLCAAIFVSVVPGFANSVQPSEIRRFNQRRAIVVAGKRLDWTALELHAAMQAGLAEIELPRGYEIEVEA